MFILILSTEMKIGNQISYLHKTGEEPLKPITLGTLLEITAQKYSKYEAIVSVEQNDRITYKELLEEADKFAAGLYKLGMKKGDRLGLWCPNMIEWGIVNMAGVRAGFITVALNPHYQTHELEYCINKTGVKVIVCPYELKYQPYYKILTEIVPEIKLTNLNRFCSERVPFLEHIILVSDINYPGTHTYNEIMSLASAPDIKTISDNQSTIKCDEPAYIMFSSGTTGLPKAIVTSHFNVVNCAYQSGKRYELNLKHHKICLQVPLFHAFGSLIGFIGALNYGSTLVLPSAKYSPSANLTALRLEKCSYIFGTPTMFIDLISLQKQKNEKIKLKIALTAGAPCNPQLITDLRSVLKLKKIKSVFGLTETSGAAFTSLPDEKGDYLVKSSVGQLVDHLEAKVINQAGEMVPMGSPGELCIRGYSIMLGYWNDNKVSKDTFDVDGWFKTGDEFVLQPNGYGQIVGRIKDMINRGGENIYPKEIEDYLFTHPSILDAKVVGIPHQRLGEEVCVCVILKDKKTLTLNELRDYCRGKLAFSKIPSLLFNLEEFPKTASGKVQKYKLVEQIVQKQDDLSNDLNTAL